MSKILEVNDLCKSFVVKKRLLGENDVVSAVNHVSLGLEEGEVLGIDGESGCGNSTVARLRLHSIRPDSGTMKLCGQDVQTFRKNMQMVFQNPYSSLNPKMNVLQNITFGLTANQVPRDEACRRAYRYLDAVGMQKSFLNKYPNSLSGGQRQRVAVEYQGDPILSFYEYGKGRSFAWASDCAPHWMPPAFCEWEYIHLFWKNMIDWVVQR